MEKMTLREQSQWLLEGNLSNFGKLGSQLGISFQGEYSPKFVIYQSFLSDISMHYASLGHLHTKQKL